MHFHKWNFKEHWYPSKYHRIVEFVCWYQECRCGATKSIDIYDDRKHRPFAYKDGELISGNEKL